MVVPTCPKKLFAVGPRKKYVDIVTDTLHASSSDLITWNTLVMIKLKWLGCIPKAQITTVSLKEWEARGAKPPFSCLTVGEDMVLPVDQYPFGGLGIYEDTESTSQFAGYVWSDWTNQTVQPMHVDKALQELINKSVAANSEATVTQSQLGSQSSTTVNVENKGSGAAASSVMSAPPEPSCSASKESSSHHCQARR